MYSVSTDRRNTYSNLSQHNRGYLLLSDAALGFLPVMDLPKTLEDLLATLSTKNFLKSWQIFDERNADIVVKLRFAGGHCSQAEVTTARYRWKAPAQVKRDQARSATYKQQHAQRTADPSVTDKQPCLSTVADVSTETVVIVEKKKTTTKKSTKSAAKPRSSRAVRPRKTETNVDQDGDIELIRACGLTPEPSPSLNVSAMSLDTCTPSPHSYIH